MGIGRVELLVVLLTALAAISVAWFARSGRWRQRRFVPLTIALLSAYALLARRLGWGELLVLAVLVVPLVFLPARLVRPGSGSRG
ncbi:MULTISPECIES: hypothetical protein [Anaeromyxobacter]|uniref:hypothetical protein n=1 Tax=Anaeromyxobacter TaxID=161492 RepID=UPI001F594AF3|nr:MULTISPECIES: hypothetical protein [unclassified Anaeromyxobacter]